MVLTCLRSRLTSRRLAKSLARSVLTDKWKSEHGSLRRGHFSIFVRRERVEVTYDYMPLYFPLFTACCLKKAVRLRLATEALADLESRGQ